MGFRLVGLVSKQYSGAVSLDLTVPFGHRSNPLSEIDDEWAYGGNIYNL